MMQDIYLYLAALVLFVGTTIFVETAMPTKKPYVEKPAAVVVEETEPEEPEAIEIYQKQPDFYPLTASERETVARVVAGEARGEDLDKEG